MCVRVRVHRCVRERTCSRESGENPFMPECLIPAVTTLFLAAETEAVLPVELASSRRLRRRE